MLAAVAGEADPGVINAHVGFFAPSSPYASDAGMEMLSGKFKLDARSRERKMPLLSRNPGPRHRRIYPTPG